MKRLLPAALTTLSLTTLMLSACAPYVRSDVNTAAISHVHCGTFAWAGEFRSNSPLRSTIANPVNESRLRTAIASHLGGVIQPVPGNADCLVGYGIGGDYVGGGAHPPPSWWGSGYPHGWGPPPYRRGPGPPPSSPAA